MLEYVRVEVLGLMVLRWRRGRGAPTAAWRVGLLLAWSVLICAISSVHAGVTLAETTAPRYAIAPGQEELLAEMLGRGAELPGGCRMTSGSVERDRARASYDCAGGTAEVVLGQPQAAPAGALPTDKFGVSVRSGSPPAGFVDALTDRIRSAEAGFRWSRLGETPIPHALDYSPVAKMWMILLIAVAVGMGNLAGRSRGRAAERMPAAAGLLATAVRAAGLAAILAYSVRCDAEGSIVWGVSAGIAVVSGFLWLVVSGAFGFGDVRRGDWLGLVVFAVALAVRELLTLHSVQEIEIQFARQAIVKHSVVYALAQLFYAPLVRDFHGSVMFVNSVLGAVACAAAYQFVRQRLSDRSAGFICGLFIAVDPVVARFSPTDGPYSLMLAAWFSALVLLSRKSADRRSVLAGMALLGIAATSRLEGSVLLLASLCLLDPRVLVRGVAEQRRAYLAGALVVGLLIALQMSLLFPGFQSADIATPRSLAAFLTQAWTVVGSKGGWYASLVLLGAASVLLARTWFGFLTCIAFLIVVAPVVESHGAVLAHRLVPSYAVLAIAAAIGAWAATAWIPLSDRWRWVLAGPGVAIAFLVVSNHRDDLSRSYVFNDEYSLVRGGLATAGSSPSSCTLMFFGTETDFGIHDFGQVVPEMTVLDCTKIDCLSYVPEDGCCYYLRASGSFVHRGPLPVGCRNAGDSTSCLNPASAAFEAALDLDPIELRVVDLDRTFGRRHHYYRYPRHAQLGLFRVSQFPADRRSGGVGPSYPVESIGVESSQ